MKCETTAKIFHLDVSSQKFGRAKQRCSWAVLQPRLKSSIRATFVKVLIPLGIKKFQHKKAGCKVVAKEKDISTTSSI